jgi:hypothetical protein
LGRSHRPCIIAGLKAPLACPVLLVVTLLSVPLPARAQPQQLSFTAGYSRSNVSPEHGGLLSIGYARSWSPHWSWLVRPELILNLEAPDGRLLKGGASGLDAGVGWTSVAEGPRLLLEGTVGARLLFEPGVGAVSRLGAGIGFPLGASGLLAFGVSAELGVGRVGDETARTEALTRADAWTRIGVAF